MALTQADLDRIDAAIANPTEETRHADRMSRKRPIQDELLARNLAAAQVAQTSGQKVTRQLRIISDSGW